MTCAISTRDSRELSSTASPPATTFLGTSPDPSGPNALSNTVTITASIRSPTGSRSTLSWEREACSFRRCLVYRVRANWSVQGKCDLLSSESPPLDACPFVSLKPTTNSLPWNQQLIHYYFIVTPSLILYTQPQTLANARGHCCKAITEDQSKQDLR